MTGELLEFVEGICISLALPDPTSTLLLLHCKVHVYIHGFEPTYPRYPSTQQVL